MENTVFLEKLKFGVGDGNLQYYLYNWKCPEMSPKRVGLVLQWSRKTMPTLFFILFQNIILEIKALFVVLISVIILANSFYFLKLNIW